VTDVFVHPQGLCESTDVGAGTRVWAFAHVLPDARIGRDCNICDGAFVEGAAVLGDNVTVKNNVLVFNGVTCEDDVFLGPNAVFTNDLRPRAHRKLGAEALLPTLVRNGATLGAGVVVVCGTTIGANAFVGAGAVVTRDVPAHAFVVGNPARQKGWVCRHCTARTAAPSTTYCPNRTVWRPWSATENRMVPGSIRAPYGSGQPPLMEPGAMEGGGAEPCGGGRLPVLTYSVIAVPAGTRLPCGDWPTTVPAGAVELNGTIVTPKPVPLSALVASVLFWFITNGTIWPWPPMFM
jgi:acetyltransferase-like isoleucine patch superfamily enzyme